MCALSSPEILQAYGSEGAVNVVEEGDSVDLAKRHFLCDNYVSWISHVFSYF